MKEFANVGVSSISEILGLKLNGRFASISRNESSNHRYLSAQIHLYLYLHFHANSNTGLTDLLSVNDLATHLSCHPKTILRSIHVLEKGGFIQTIESPEYGYVVLQILNLSEMYKRRGEGGKGYFTCNRDLLNTMLEIKQINVLRAALTAMIETVSSLAKSSAKLVGEVRLTLDTLKASFPASARPSDIRKACQNDGLFGVLFSRTNPDLKKTISVRLQDAYNAVEIKQSLRRQAKRVIFDEIDQINQILREINTDIFEDHRIHCYNAANLFKHHIELWNYIDPIHQEKQLPLLDLPSDVKNDCVTIAQDYGIDTVLDAIRLYYKKYLLSNEIQFTPSKTKSLGGLIRSIVSELYHIFPVTA